MPLAPTRIIPITRKALFFDGVDDYGEGSLVYNNTVTVCAMVKLRALPSQVGQHLGIFSFNDGTDYNRVNFLITQYGDVLAYWDSLNGWEKTDFVPSVNVWYLFTWTRTEQNIRFYVNGQYLTTTDNDGNWQNISTALDTFWIGRTSTTVEYFYGEIAYVLIYNRALSDDEIAQIYNDPDHPPKSGLVLWLYDTSIDVENNVWRDLSGKGNNAPIYGATAVDVVRPATRVLDATRVIEPTR